MENMMDEHVNGNYVRDFDYQHFFDSLLLY